MIKWTDSFIIESIIIIGILLFQIYITKSLVERINRFKKIFEFPIEVDIDDENEEKQVPILKAKSNHEVLQSILKSLNDYLKNNYSFGIHFHIVKDIIDREVHAKEEEITQTLPSPLYLGLVGTLIGIFFGISSMWWGRETFDEDGLMGLLQAVAIAVFASAFGLIMTTVLSNIHYKRAFQLVLEGKNKTLSYLQTRLLPKLHKIEETGLEGLKLGLDRFTKNAKTLSQDFIKTHNQSSENLEKQINLIEKVEKLDVSRWAKHSSELFNRIDQNMEAYKSFSDYLVSIEKVSDNIEKFSVRTSEVERIIQDINNNFIVSTKLASLLGSHLEEIESSKNYAIDFIGLSKKEIEGFVGLVNEEVKSNFSNSVNKINDYIGDVNNRFEKSVDLLRDKIKNINSVIETSLDTLDRHIDKSSSKIQKTVNEMTNKYEFVLKDLSERSNKLDLFDNLLELPKLNSTSRDILENIDTISNSLERINSDTSQIDTHSNNVYYKSGEILNRLEEIQKKLEEDESIAEITNDLIEKVEKLTFVINSKLGENKNVWIG